MLVGNTTNQSTTVELAYYRQHLKSGIVEKDTKLVQVDLGPEIVKRAHQVLAVQCDVWNASSRDWKYWTA